VDTRAYWLDSKDFFGSVAPFLEDHNFAQDKI
jgi:hypothetical protein